MSHDHFIVPAKYYVGTFGALLVLTVITVAAAQIDLGSTANLILALLIAGVKATLVVTIFMGLKWDNRFNLAAFIGGISFIGIFFLLVFADVMTRADIEKIEGGIVEIHSPVTVVSELSEHHGEDSHGLDHDSQTGH